MQRNFHLIEDVLDLINFNCVECNLILRFPIHFEV
jgi:hypothetical protein